MKALLITALTATLALSLSACGSSGDDPNDLVKLPTIGSVGEESTTGGGTSTNSGGELNPGLLNGRHSVELGSVKVIKEEEINYESVQQQILYTASDLDSEVICIATFTIGLVDTGPNPTYTAFINNTEAQDAQTVSILDIQGPTNNVGIEYIYSIFINDVSWTSIAHAHYLSPQDVTFGNPAFATVECASPTNKYGQNEAQMRTVLNSVRYLRGTETSTLSFAW